MMTCSGRPPQEREAKRETWIWAGDCAHLERGSPLAPLGGVIAMANTLLIAAGRYDEARHLREDWIHAVAHVADLEATLAGLIES